MSDPVARLLRLLSLFQRQPVWGGPELAGLLGVTQRTVRRDIDRLRELGYPVESHPGSTGGYRLTAGASMPPLTLDDDEALAVAVSLRSAAGGSVTGLAEPALAALAKLDQVLPSRLRPQLEALTSMTITLDDGRTDTGASGDALVAVARACREHLVLRFDYTDASGQGSERVTEPYRLVMTGRRWYLVARDVRRDAWRTFRVDRLSSPEAPGHRFELVDPPDAAALVAEGITTRPYEHQARLVVAAPVEDLADHIPASVGFLEAIDDDTTRLTIGSNHLDWMVVRLVMMDVDLTIVEPPALQDRVAHLAARLTHMSDHVPDLTHDHETEPKEPPCPQD